MVISNKNGLYCPVGDFYIDPWKPVETAIITHAHSDHFTSGSKNYICSKSTEPLIEHRHYGENGYNVKSYEYDECFSINGVTISLHPAGHILGSAQVKLEYKGEVWVVSGDYKLASDPTCQSFTLQSCDVFVTEATFGIPIYRWKESEIIAKEIHDWWLNNAEDHKSSILFGYSLGKSQRILAELAKLTDNTVYIHGALHDINEIYRQQGVDLVQTELIRDQEDKKDYTEDLIMAPPSAHKTPWVKRFPNCVTAFASGWMRVRGRRRMGGYDKGFVLSDHVDWPGLIDTITKTGANKIYISFGRSSTILEQYLNEELGIDAQHLDYRTNRSEND